MYSNSINNTINDKQSHGNCEVTKLFSLEFIVTYLCCECNNRKFPCDFGNMLRHLMIEFLLISNFRVMHELEIDAMLIWTCVNLRF